MDTPLDGDQSTTEESPDSRNLSRRPVLRAALAAGVAVPAALMGVPALARTIPSTGGTLEPTPQCDDGDDPTPPQTEGPYFKPNSPRRSSLVDANTVGTRLTVTGFVFGLRCQPIANVLLDFWQADNNGVYDNTGFKFRGHQFTDAQGKFTLTTIVPGLYPGRTRHIHVKLQAPGQRVLTTQLYFPNEPRNNTDTIFDPRLLMQVRNVGQGREAVYDFVLNVQQNPNPTSGTTPTTTSSVPVGTWTAGTAYSPGASVTYGGVSYICLQSHTAQAGWEPPNVPALWRVA
ncbi:dioxygenase family protein [Saccharothrix obliqua]|uniref:dioxygenase family protein n=1 Tax=Saccharothrix obliqua TaxID=2861747 RepID=UPI001C5D1E73|nr:carbohydrate-binding protein [Saccharothrix obliqua]MBW4719069.1 dioxygenase [Saccharothrix obliqua]